MLIASACQGHDSLATPAAQPAAGGGGHRSACRRGNPLANVYHPYRLKVRRRCLTVTGTVAYLSSENDGDLHVDLRLPTNEAWLLNSANAAHQHDQLVTEIVPADQPGCTVGEPPRSPHGSYNFGTCTGADIATPPVGAVIRVTGPYVLDANHGWMEIHPVWRIVVLSKPPSAAPTPTSPNPPPTVGAWCRANASAANDGYPGDFNIMVWSNQPHETAQASDGSDSFGHETNGSGHAVVFLWHQSAGEVVDVTVGAASCTTTIG